MTEDKNSKKYWLSQGVSIEGNSASRVNEDADVEENAKRIAAVMEQARRITERRLEGAPEGCNCPRCSCLREYREEKA